MSREQWGHGFHCGATAASKANSGTMVGLWFNSMKDGKREWQGQVEKELPSTQYLVQLYEWGFGEPSIKKIVSLDAMKDWIFYGSNVDMRLAYSREIGQSDHDFWRFEDQWNAANRRAPKKSTDERILEIVGRARRARRTE
jgi:hypothetical protein